MLKNGYLVSASFDNTIKIWNTDAQSLIRTLIGHTNSIRSVLVLSNGYLASGGHDNTIRIWNPDTGLIIKNITGHEKTINSLVQLPNGYLASGGFDTFIKSWKLDYLSDSTTTTPLTSTNSMSFCKLKFF